MSKPKKLLKIVGITTGVLLLCGVSILATGWAWFSWQVYHPQLLVSVSVGHPIDEITLNDRPMKLVHESESVLPSGRVARALLYEGRAQPGLVTVRFRSHGEPVQFQFKGERGDRNFFEWLDYMIFVRETRPNIEEPRAVPLETGLTFEAGSVVSTGDLLIYIERPP